MTCTLYGPHIAPTSCSRYVHGRLTGFDGFLTMFMVDSGWTPYGGNEHPYRENCSGKLRFCGFDQTPTEKIVRLSTTPSSEICG